MYSISRAAAVLLLATAGAGGTAMADNDVQVQTPGPVMGAWEDRENQVTAIKQQTTIKELLAKHVKADIELTKAKREQQAEVGRDQSEALIERNEVLEQQLDGYRAMIRTMQSTMAENAQQASLIQAQQKQVQSIDKSAANGDDNSNNAAPEMIVYSTAEGGRARSTARVAVDTGQQFTVREGSPLNGWTVIEIAAGTVKFQKDGVIYTYGEQGLIK